MENQRFDFDTFLSPFSWRYGSKEMRFIWSEVNKRITLRKIWVALAKAQNKAGLVSNEQVKNLESHINDIDIGRALEIEKDIKHDLMAEIKTFAEKAEVGAPIIHLGATSMDILDNMDAIRLKDSLSLVSESLKILIHSFSKLISETVDIVCMAFTHLQSAEPTLFGYRVAFWTQDLIDCYKNISSFEIKGKGFKGAVGTAESYETLLKGTKMSFSEMERQVLDSLNLKAYEVSTQVYTRRQDLEVIHLLSSLCASISKIALDIRMLQSSGIAEVSEPFGKKQVGSSAMPFKRNPINCEKINSLCRVVRSCENIAWDNESLCILERTLDDSANRRVYIPQAFLAVDEIIKTLTKVIDGFVIKKTAIKKNLENFGIFSATETLLMEAVKKGGDRQKLHEEIRNASLEAYKVLEESGVNPLRDILKDNKTFLSYLSKNEILKALELNFDFKWAKSAATRIAKTASQL